MTRLEPPHSGWTKTPNRLLDETARAGAALPARHRSILDLLVRELFGWHHQAVAIAERTIAARLQISRRTVHEVVLDLERWRLVRRRGAGRGRTATFELLDPRGWRICKTAGAIRQTERRRRAAGGDQPLLPFGDVGMVLDLPTRLGVTCRDTCRDLPARSVRALLIEKRKKSRAAATAIEGDTVRMALSCPRDRMPNDPPEEMTSPAERAAIRRTRAARSMIRRLGTGDPLDAELVARTATALSELQIENEIRHLQLRQEEAERVRVARAQADAMRHEGRR